MSATGTIQWNGRQPTFCTVRYGTNGKLLRTMCSLCLIGMNANNSSGSRNKSDVRTVQYGIYCRRTAVCRRVCCDELHYPSRRMDSLTHSLFRASCLHFCHCLPPEQLILLLLVVLPPK